MGDIQLIYNLTSTYQVVLGSTNIGNHTNKAYGPYIGRAGYLEIKTKLERKKHEKTNAIYNTIRAYTI